VPTAGCWDVGNTLAVQGLRSVDQEWQAVKKEIGETGSTKMASGDNGRRI